jgi:hypothetical protein
MPKTVEVLLPFSHAVLASAFLSLMVEDADVLVDGIPVPLVVTVHSQVYSFLQEVKNNPANAINNSAFFIF